MKLQFTPAGSVARAQLEDMLDGRTLAGYELTTALQNEPHTLTAVTLDGEVVALICMEAGTNASYLLVFVAPKHRRRGIGTQVLKYAQGRLESSGTRKIRTQYEATDEAARCFARKFGYARQFSSAFMRRANERFPVDNEFIRAYHDEHYERGHEAYARAFHEMRVSVGDFPNSVPEPPSEKNRRSWAEDAANRFTCEQGGVAVGHAHIEGNELSSVSMAPEWQGRGLGERFVKAMCNEIYSRGHREAVLWCVTGNRARHLYDRLGFEEVYKAEFAAKDIK